MNNKKKSVGLSADADPHQEAVVTHPITDFDNKILQLLEDVKKLGKPSTFNQGQKTRPKAATEIFEEFKSVINFFETANASSGIHELMHHVLNIYDKLSDMETTAGWMKQDFNTILKEFGVTKEEFRGDSPLRDLPMLNDNEDAHKYLSEDPDISIRDYVHERFSQGFEVYASTGEAPNQNLRAAFKKLRKWLIDIYQDVQKALGVKLSPTMKGIYDRLLATPEEIHAEREARNQAAESEQIDQYEAEQKEISATLNALNIILKTPTKSDEAYFKSDVEAVNPTTSHTKRDVDPDIPQAKENAGQPEFAPEELKEAGKAKQTITKANAVQKASKMMNQKTPEGTAARETYNKAKSKAKAQGASEDEAKKAGFQAVVDSVSPTEAGTQAAQGNRKVPPEVWAQRHDLVAWGRQETTRMTEAAEFAEGEETADNALSEEDLTRFQEINDVMKRKDYARLYEMRADEMRQKIQRIRDLNPAQWSREEHEQNKDTLDAMDIVETYYQDDKNTLSETSTNVQHGRYTTIKDLVKAALTKAGRAISGNIFVDYSIVSKQNAKAILDATGLDVSGYTRTLTGSSVAHIIKQHGENGVRIKDHQNQLPVGVEDFDLLPKILENPDVIESGVSGRGLDVIVSKKQIGDKYIVLEEAFSGRKKLVPLSMWKEDVDYKKPGTPPSTSETFQPPRLADDIPSDANLSSRDKDVKGSESLFEPENPQAMDKSAAKVRDDVKRQLIDAGVNEKEAEANGNIVAAAMVNFAKREGMSPDAFYKLLGPTFVRDEVIGNRKDQTGKKGPRGAITLPARMGGKGLKITLTPTADVTTNIHELGHLFRWIMEHQAARFKNDAQLQADWKATQKFGDHAKFADGFIEYVKTGKAPNSALRRAFEQFKQWLTDFYQHVHGTGVKLSDEIRGVFDRILAGDSTFEETYGMENSLKSTGNQTYDSEMSEAAKRAKVIPIDTQAVPVDYKNTKALIKWVKGELQGKHIVIKDDNLEIEFTGQGLRDSGKVRGKEQRQAYTVLEGLVENSVFDHFEDADERHPDLIGQNVYYVGAKIGNGEKSRYFSVRIKVDMPKSAQTPSYKGHATKEIVPDPSLGLSANAAVSRSAWGTISEITLDVLSGKVNPSEVDNNILHQEALEEGKQQDPRLEPVKSKNPNIEIMRKKRDTSRNTRLMDYVNSPNIVAERHALFRPFLNMANDAQAKQDRMRTNWNRTADKIYGKPGIFGRQEGLVSEEKHEVFNKILIKGDMLGKVFSNEELTELGADANMIKAYKMVRALFDNAHRMLSDQRNKYNKEDVNYREGYVPHFFHAWRVMKDGKIVTSYRSMSEAAKAAEGMLKENPNDKLQIMPAMDDFGGQAKVDAVTLGDMQYFKLIHNVENTFALSTEDARAFLDDVARMKNRSRVFKNAWQRKGSTGFDTDMEYALRHYMNLSARYFAMDTLKHDGINLFERTFGRFNNEHKGLAGYTKRYLNDVLGVLGTIEETLNNWIRDSWIGQHIPDYIGDRPATMGANMLASGVAHAKLGVLNVASALMNLTQLNGTQALIGLKYTGRGIAEYVHPTLITQRLYREAGIEENISMENPSGYSKIHNVRGALTNASMALFRYADGMVRKATLIGAYRKGIDEGMSRAEAIEYAKKINEDVNFNYSVADTPDLFRRAGPLGTLLLQFKKYGVKQAELALPGFGKLKGKQMARFWALQLALSGLVGLPAFDLIKNIWKYFFDDDVELELKSLVGKSGLPAPVKRTVLYGALSNAGIDIGRRVGMGDFVPSSMGDFAGPTLSTVDQVARAFPKIFTDGNFIDTLEALSPGIANPVKAFMTGEMTDKRRGRTRFKYETTMKRPARKWRELRGPGLSANPWKAMR
ncbi:MAG: hypothetical protein LBJ36_04735 [Synergistaceae bacterium]|nr:hypothetical protein [Synergistaceae bacterium]